jgi:hypothetical protein
LSRVFSTHHQCIDLTEIVMAEERLKILEERLTRLEANLQRASAGGGGFTTPGGPITDSPPWPIGNLAFAARPSPVVDPAPWPYGWGRPRFIADPAPYPHPIVDPAPWPNPIADPAVFAQSLAASQSLAARIGRVADPAPPDVTRLSVVQLESALHSIAAERARLDSMEQLINKQLETAKKQQQTG